MLDRVKPAPPSRSADHLELWIGRNLLYWTGEQCCVSVTHRTPVPAHFWLGAYISLHGYISLVLSRRQLNVPFSPISS